MTYIKSSKGRNTNKLPDVPSVETKPCPSGGLHVLTNDEEARTYCQGCGSSWAELDAEVRAAIRSAVSGACSCGTPLVAQWTWRRAEPEQRAAWLADGIGERRGSQCVPCYKATRKEAS